MQLDQLFGEREADAGARLRTRARLVDLIEPLEDMRQVLGRDSWSAIDDFDPRDAAFGLDMQGDAATIRREPRRSRADCLTPSRARPSRTRHRSVGRCDDVEAMWFCAAICPNAAATPRAKRHQVLRRARELHLAGFELRDVEHLIHQPRSRRALRSAMSISPRVWIAGARARANPPADQSSGSAAFETRDTFAKNRDFARSSSLS